MKAEDPKKLMIQCLLKANDPTHFVQEAFRALNSQMRKTTYAALARKMEFKSRSFVRQLVEGSKKPNLSNYKQIGKGLGLSTSGLRYLELLIEKQIKPVEQHHKIFIELQELRNKLNRSLDRSILEKKGSHLISLDAWPYVYASLGETEVGKSLEDISLLSKTSIQNCQHILDALIKQNMAGYNSVTQFYYATASVINIGALGENAFFKKHFQSSAQRALNLSDKNFDSPDTLFYTSVFSVKKKDLPKLATQLQQVMSQYMIESEHAAGDELAVLTTSLMPHSL